ncbi:MULTISPECIES: glutamic-type intramembrane protease PrsW [Paenibacillus]|uniref:Protease PrsW n=1 Tax=Paenibacillus helianthi TaxID=1349432 RepID=A0ABX3ENH1_9BACL|nr:MULTISPECIES: glutamic-type intramembrane protease PrsW [Paenibacillus]OKP75412.1 peptidase [Paenibacillus sp. P3E]OKP84430.1 peptidase [Paenibacillus sp. P32E]OKP86745.1 peptidase [Paenibacillus helianthi]OKP93648.1 peptidase [Paenibacillus sp. P46E]
MLLLSVISSAVAPGLALLTFFYLKDKYDQEPLFMVLKVFLLGILIVFPIMIIQRGLVLGLDGGPYADAFLISSGVEECLKWFVLYHMIYNHTEFDEPYDGILYAVAISLGFATLENVMYAWYSHASIGSMFMRALLPVSGHAMFGVIMGYHMGRAKFSGGVKTRGILIMSLLLPWLWHGIYDFILTTMTNTWIWFIVPLMAVLWYGGMGKVARANSRSPFRFLKREEEINL